jgi:hypothetical protein
VKRVLVISIGAVVGLALLLVATVFLGMASAHVPTVTADCQNGLAVSASAYSPPPAINTATVTFDNQVVYVNPNFGTGFTFTKANPDKTVAHTYSVDIVSAVGEGTLHTGVVSIPSCVTPPPPPHPVPPAPPAPPVVTPPHTAG